MTEPTDAELEALLVVLPADVRTAVVKAMREAFAKWGTPPAVAPVRSAVLDLIDECQGLTMEQDRWLSRRVKELDFASTPQPTQAQAGAVPLTDEQITDAAEDEDDDSAFMAGFATGARFAEQHHGIKGGQHVDTGTHHGTNDPD